MSSTSCPHLLKQVQALQKWKEKFQQQSALTFPLNCDRTPELKEVDITSLIPVQLKDLFLDSPFFDGGNCFGACLIGAGRTQHTRFFSEVELSEELTTCQQKNTATDGPPAPGDSVVLMQRVSSEQVTPIHAFTYLTDDMNFTKDGKFKTQSYRMMSLKEEYSIYQVDPKDNCRNGRLPIPTSCQVYAVFYSCPPLDPVLARFSKDYSHESLSCDLSTLAMTGNSPLLQLHGTFETYKKTMGILIDQLKNGASGITSVKKKKVIAASLQVNLEMVSKNQQDRLIAAKEIERREIERGIKLSAAEKLIIERRNELNETGFLGVMKLGDVFPLVSGKEPHYLAFWEDPNYVAQGILSMVYKDKNGHVEFFLVKVEKEGYSIPDFVDRPIRMLYEAEVAFIHAYEAKFFSSETKTPTAHSEGVTNYANSLL